MGYFRNIHLISWWKSSRYVKYQIYRPQDKRDKYGDIGYGVRPTERKKGYAHIS